MNWDDLRILLAAVRAGSFTGAGRLVGMDQSTVSRRVVALEEALGTALFLRTRDGIHATRAGEALYAAAERVEQEIAHARGAASETAVTGVVRVACTEAFASLLIQNGLGELSTVHPGLTIELVIGNRPVDLLRDEADLALRIVRPREGDLKARKVGELTFAVCASPAYLMRRGAPRYGEDLSGHDVVVAWGELSETPETKWMLAHKAARVVIRCNSMPALAAAVAAGCGLGVLPLSWSLAGPRFERLFVVPEIPSRSVWLVVHPSTLGRPAARLAAEAVARLVAQATGWRAIKGD